MNNSFLKFRFQIYSIFGLIPAADKIERKEQSLESEFNALLEYQNSDELARYEELKQYVHSKEFRKKKKEINASKYKNSEPWNKEKRYRKLLKTEPTKIEAFFSVAGEKEGDMRKINRFIWI